MGAMNGEFSILNHLPTEIIALVLARLNREDLKTARYVDNAYNDIATKLLFSEIHISPNSFSCDRAHAVARSEHLRKCVKGIVYHTGQLSDDYEGYDDFRKQISMVPGRFPTELQQLSEVLLPLYAGWLEEIDAQRTFNLGSEKTQIAGLCRLFPNVESASAIMDECDPFDLPVDYIGKRTGMPLAEHTPGMHLTALMEGLRIARLRRICGRAISWHELSNMTNGEYDFNNITSLELGLWNAEYVDAESTDRNIFIKSLSELLSRMVALQELILDLDELPFSAGDIKLNEVSDVLYCKRWQCLRRLELKGLTVTAEDFGEFLAAHNQTLRYLHLGDIEFEPQAEGGEHLLGPFHLFKKLRHTMHLLQHCELSGNFIQQPIAAWFVNSPARSSDSLVTRLERYICGEDVGPPGFMIEILRQRQSVYTKENSVSVRSGDICEEQWDSLSRTTEFIVFCDESWQWCPEFVDPDIVNRALD